MSSPPFDPRSDASSPIPGRTQARGRAATWLAFLGIPSFGFTAIAGLALGLAGLGQRPRGWSIAAVVVSFVVLAGWLGGLAGALEAMRSHLVPVQTVWPAGSILGGRLAALAGQSADPVDPVRPDDEVLDAMLDSLPPSLRVFGDPPTPLAVQPLPVGPGVFLRCWIGAPLDPEVGSLVTAVDQSRGGIFAFAVDGRTVWSIDRALDPDRAAFDDVDTADLAATAPYARAIAAFADSRKGRLPDAIEAKAVLESVEGPGVPGYRPRPGGLFDLLVPGTRRSVTYTASGGILVPLRP